VGGLEEASSQKGRIVPSAVVAKNGEKIGLVGATTQVLEQISSTGGVEVKGFIGDGSERDDMALLASQLQPVIDDLISQGVNKVILMAHLQQIANEKALAPLLRGVDIILAGGSNTRLGDSNDQAVAFPGHAANFADPYPLVTQGADGAPTLIVNTDNEYTYLGRLVVDFDAQGRIILGSVDPLVSGAYAATAANVAKAWNVSEAQLATTAFADGTKAENVQDLTDAVQAVIASKDGQVWGFTQVYLEGERAFVRSEETNLGDLTADANLAYAKQIDPSVVISLKNGGGIRSQIGSVDVVSGAKQPPLANPSANKPAGGISTLDIENSLRFNNSLSLVTVSASKLKELLEHGIAVYPNQGRFPQVSGLAFSFDLTRPAGSRILNLAIQDSQGNDLDVLVRGGVLVGDSARTFRMVTLNFLASGGDSYPFPTDAAANRVDLFSSTAPLTGAATFSGDGTEQDALAEHLKANYATLAKAYSLADSSAAQDLRLQNTSLRTDEVIDVKIGTAGADDSLTSQPIKLQGFDGKNDLLFSGAGEDIVDVASLSGFANRIFTGSGNDAIYAGSRDVITGGSGDDEIWAIDGDGNRLSAGLGNDTFIIGSSANRALGGAGDDKFYVLGGAGTNHLNGGAAADQFWLVSEIGDLPASKQFVMDFQLGADKVGLAGVAFSSLSFSQVGSDTLLKVAGVEVGHFTNLSAVSLNNQSNFAGLS
jgi:2',3'-cyclic-nucleotide 2'-phosphodiesterase (5'-nucleotidase family)